MGEFPENSGLLIDTTASARCWRFNLSFSGNKGTAGSDPEWIEAEFAFYFGDFPQRSA